jgi:hypothetical protein
MKIERKIQCCGSSLEGRRISLPALASFCFPAVLILTVVWPVVRLLSVMAPFLRSFADALRTILEANLLLIRQADVAPMIKCSLSSRLISRSPRLAGLAFRHFNFAVFTAVFVAGVALVLAMAWVVEAWI